MTPEGAVDIIRQALMTSVWVMAPLLLAGLVVGVVINIVQVATSLQDSAFSSVPRLAAFFAAFLVLMPWMLHKLMAYTVALFGNLGQYAR
ncbi:MAG TPA: flagellar biosynthetic protein FliQ [Bryobacteraceae bacterium]|nr:flagellar biosynthetic protein FliQ [Bryobacteraceae bacterium]